MIHRVAKSRTRLKRFSTHLWKCRFCLCGSGMRAESWLQKGTQVVPRQFVENHLGQWGSRDHLAQYFSSSAAYWDHLGNFETTDACDPPKVSLLSGLRLGHGDSWKLFGWFYWRTKIEIYWSGPALTSYRWKNSMCEVPCLRPHPGWISITSVLPFKLYNIFSITSPTEEENGIASSPSPSIVPQQHGLERDVFSQSVSFHVCLFHERRQWRSVRLNADTVKFCRGKCVFRDTLLSFIPCLSRILFSGIYGRKKNSKQLQSSFLFSLPTSLPPSFPFFSYSLSLLRHLPECYTAQSCPTLCNHMDCSLPDSPIHGTFQARILEWVAISFSRGSSRPRDWTRVSCIVGRCSTIWTTREVRKTFTWKLQNARPWYLLSTEWGHLVEMGTQMVPGSF